MENRERAEYATRMRRLHLLALAIAAIAASASCSKTEDGALTPPPPPGVCPACAPPETRGAILSRAVDEASGLVASAIHAGVMYVHNDSGDKARFFAMTKTGGHLGAFEVQGAGAFDWEDVALGPCSVTGAGAGEGAAGEGKTSSCLYFGDVGDNQKQRASSVIYRVPEPASFTSSDRSTRAEALPFVYPDGRHNAETLLIHPITGVVTIVTKVSSGTSPVFELPMPLSPGQTVTLVREGQVKPPRGSARFTGGAVHPQGKGVLLRTYTHIFYYPMGPNQTVAQALAGPACPMPAADEIQGESITWLPSGTGYMTVSEGESPPIYLVECGR
jgi:hypothetical protein